MIDFTKKYRPGLVWSTNSDREPKSQAGRMLMASLIVGPPQATEACSVERLVREDIVGLYLPPDAPEIRTGEGGLW